jgi:uncharacterized linocin/CFP29 family protein
MADSQLGWSDAQWEKVNTAVTEAFTKASVAGAFLPCYGPLAASAENVRAVTLSLEIKKDRSIITVQDDTTSKLFNLTVRVQLSSEQVADDALSSAVLAFRRAANTLALVEDEIIFNGFDPSVKVGTQVARALQGAPPPNDRIRLAARTHSVVANAPDFLDGLAAHPDQANANQARVELRQTGPGPKTVQNDGPALVNQIAASIASLEAVSNPGPFACVLGHELFITAYDPSSSLVLPADRITPMLGGPLLRSGSMEPNHGIVVSLASDAIDIVVATPPTVQFLQRTENSKYLFRVYERFMLRVKDGVNPAVDAFEIRSGGRRSPAPFPSTPAGRIPSTRKRARKNRSLAIRKRRVSPLKRSAGPVVRKSGGAQERSPRRKAALKRKRKKAGGIEQPIG